MRFLLSFIVKLMETTFEACLINDLIDDLILHVWKGSLTA